MKRRLALLPEVLPDPTPHYPAGAPRSRTLVHLTKLRMQIDAWVTEKDGAIELEISAPNVTFPDVPAPFGFGITSLRVAQSGEVLILRMRPLPGVEVVSVVASAVASTRPTKIAAKITLDPLSVHVTSGEP